MENNDRAKSLTIILHVIFGETTTSPSGLKGDFSVHLSLDEMMEPRRRQQLGINHFHNLRHLLLGTSALSIHQRSCR